MSMTGARKQKNEIEQLTPTKILILRMKKALGNRTGWIKGVILTAVLAVLAGSLARLPFFSVMGVMIISIILGMAWKGLMGIPENSQAGITFSSKILLRAGIILMGLRLNFEQIISAGYSIIIIDIAVIAFTLSVMLYIGKLLSIDKHLSALIAVGTAVCGAAAIVAVAPLIGARKELTAISVAFIAIAGTVVTIIYSFLYPYLDMNSYDYGLLTGSTLHELAHVIAAAVPGGAESSDTAILVKLGRVALLIPVALILAYFYKKDSVSDERMTLKNLPVPWFIFGFLAMCLVNTIGLLPPLLTSGLIDSSVFLLSMAMAGLGLGVNFAEFKNLNSKVIFTGIAGSVSLIFLGILITKIF